MTTSTTTPEFFEDKYRHNADPWTFASSPYELKRYSTITAALRGERFHQAFEPGCSVGVLTEMLAPQCDHLHAIDVSQTAVNEARKRCASMSHVEIVAGSLPEDIPNLKFDLVVFSEIGYYFEADRLAKIASDLVLRLNPSGVFLAAHWLGHSPDHLLSGDRVHETLSNLEGIGLDISERFDGFRLDRWKRV
jgi:trans-aconitate methyltransferase